MPIASEIAQKMPQVYELLEKFEVSDAWMFGSAQSEKFTKNSDVDIMVQFKEKITPLRLGMNMNDLNFSLQKLFEREVDLVSYSHIKNPAHIRRRKSKTLCATHDELHCENSNIHASM